MDKKEIIENGEFGEIQCQIAPIGEFYGSDRDGNAISETLTSESLENLANKLNESGKEILCDKDHASVKPGTDRDTEAQGWFSRFFIDPIKGLMGWLKLTKSGREAIENREYRFLSPVFSLDDESKTPTNLHSVAMTNCAALPVEPILNTEPKDTEIMTKEEIITLIRETLAEINRKDDKNDVDDVDDKDEVCNACQKKAENEMPDADKKDDTEKPVDEKPVEKTETVDSDKPETTDDMKEDEKKETETVSSNSCQKKEDSMNEKTCDGDEVKKTKEVIKEEVLNSSPSASMNIEITAEPAWKNKTGEAFWSELRKMGYRV